MLTPIYIAPRSRNGADSSDQSNIHAMEHNTPLSTSSHHLRHRDIEYLIVQGEGGVWKWSASVDGVAIMGLATSRLEAVVGAESAIDQALASKGGA